MEATIKTLSRNPKYKEEAKEGFFRDLNARVNEYFRKHDLPKKGGWQVTSKVVFLMTWFILSYYLLLSGKFHGWALFLCGLAFGISHVLIVFNIAHDAAHDALFKKRTLNRLFSYSFNLVGTNAYMWQLNHNQLHHSYPNVASVDPDIHQQAPFLRVSPTVPLKPFHRYQVYYATLVYMSYSLFLVFFKDFKDFGWFPDPNKTLLKPKKHPLKEHLILIASKAIYFGYTIIVPFIVLDLPWQQFLAAYVGIHICLSLLLASVLVPVHMVEEASYGQLDEQDNLKDSWAVHVFKNTTDYSRKSRFANFFFGGLNTHMAHHLFPHICHVHYMAISEILRNSAKKFKLVYRDVSMAEAIASHFRLLKKFSQGS